MVEKRTKLLHTGRSPQSCGGAVNTPVVRASTILFEDFEAYDKAVTGRSEALTYGRYGTATRHHLEDEIAMLDEADAAFLFPSGQAAIAFALLATLNPGDHVLVADTVYDPCRKYCDAELKRLGVAVTYYDPMAGDEIGSLFQPNTKAIYLESPGSMTFEVQDTRKLAEIAHQHGALVLADCTWATPLAPSPFSLGIDVNIQALTKYACGHADVLMGAITVKGKLAKQLETQYKHYGMNVSPDDCYLMLRGLRTLAVRVEQQEQTGLKLAEWFKARPETRRVLHPAFESCPGHAHWKRDIGRSCGLFSVIIDPYDKKALAAMFDGFKIFGMGFSWGGFESLLIALDPKSIRTAKPWVEEGVLLRIHAGLEAPEDLIAELEEGFKRLNAAA